jgi:hypothetical protein
MLALGAYLFVAVAAAQPAVPAHAVEKLASTYDEAACDPSDGGECAEEVELSEEAAPPAILDCESPLIADMIGSCDMPKPTLPTLHVATLRNGGAGVVVGGGGGEHDHLRIVTGASSTEAALPIRGPTLVPAAPADLLFAFLDHARDDAPRARLDRPPRA